LIGIKNIIDRTKKHPIYIHEITNWRTNYPTENDKDPIIDDIADRRNEIAHNHPDNLLSLKTLLAYADYIAIIGRSMSHIVLSEYLLGLCSDSNLVAVGHPVDVFNNHIACFILDNLTLSKDDYLIVVNGDNTMYTNPINSMHHDRKSIESIAEWGKVTVCVECAHKVKKDDELYILYSELVN